MMDQPLHMPTLYGVTATIVAFCGALLLLAPSPSEARRTVTLWSAAILTGAAGLVLMAFGSAAPGVVSDVVAPPVLLLAVSVAWAAAREFGARAAPVWIVAAGPGAWLALSQLPWPPGRHDLLAGVACLIGAGYTIASAAELWRDRAEFVPSRSPAVMLLLVHAGFYVGRVAFAPFLPADIQPSSLVAVSLLEAMLHTVGTSFVLMAMIKERSELRSTTQLRQFALFDGLTGLSNRRHFDQTLDREFQRALRTTSVLSLLMIDIDHFKAFNDRYGHQGGDVALQQVALAISAKLHRPTDLAARYGGEEMAVLLPGADEPGAASLAHDIRIAVRALQLPHAGSPLGRVAVSVGVATIVPGRGLAEPALLVRAADQALYAAKAAGRDTIRSAGLLLAPSDRIPRPRLVHPAQAGA